jgi:hypothetical protein
LQVKATYFNTLEKIYYSPMQHYPLNETIVRSLLKPETELEAAFLEDKAFYDGLLWGEPRFGHPEGQVVFHIPDILENIDQLPIDADMRRKLRLIAFAHDTFKYIEDKSTPRDWSKHHGVYARRFLERHTTELDVLEVTELHDEAYYCWRLYTQMHEDARGNERLNELLWRLGDFLQLFYLFFKCDTRTGDKVQTPVKWFEKLMSDKISVVEFRK